MTATAEPLTLSQAGRKVPGGVAPSTVWRWAREGVRARTGEVVRLRCVRAGRKLLIPSDAMIEFFEATAAADAGAFPERAPVTSQRRRPRSATQRQAEIEAAESRLANA